MLAGKAKQREAGTMSNSTNLMPSCELQQQWWTILLKSRRVSAKSGLLSIACVQLGPRKLSVIQSSGVSAIQGLLKY